MKAISSSPNLMAYSLCKSSTFIVFMCLALLFSNEHIAQGDDQLCEVTSALYDTNDCPDDYSCDSNCKGYEGAISGQCGGDKGKTCLCTRKCQEGSVCAAPSGRFGGPCMDRDACLNLCKGGEGSIGGGCKDFKCICIHNC